MVTQVQSLSSATQNIFKVATGIGAQFDLETLAVVSKNTPVEVTVTLWQALPEGLIMSKSIANCQ